MYKIKNHATYEGLTLLKSVYIIIISLVFVKVSKYTLKACNLKNLSMSIIFTEPSMCLPLDDSAFSSILPSILLFQLS